MATRQEFRERLAEKRLAEEASKKKKPKKEVVSKLTETETTE